ncbi:MAG: hypothetical protein ACT4O1_01185 [Gemmatimonadota bacterium]
MTPKSAASVLLIAEDGYLRAMLARALQRRNYDVTASATLPGAGTAKTVGEFDVLIVDIEEAELGELRRIRLALPYLPLLLILDRPSDAEYATTLGDTIQTLTKPFGLAALYQSLDILLALE